MDGLTRMGGRLVRLGPLRLLGDAALRRVAGNTGWLIGDRLVRGALGIVVGAWTARYLGPSQFGQLAYVITLAAFFQTVVNLGADTIAVRDIARDPVRAPVILGTLLRLRMVAGLGCWALMVAVAAAFDTAGGGLALLAAIVGGVLLFQSGDTVDLWFQSQSQSRRTVVAKLVAYALASGLKVAMILAEAPLAAFAATTLFEFGAAALALALAYRRFPAPAPWVHDRSVARQLVAEAWPFLVSALSIAIYMRIDMVMLKALRGDREVGIYAAALPWSQIWQMIPMTLAISFGPYVARRKLAGEAEYHAALGIAFRLFAALALLASLAMALSAPLILPALYGPGFAGSVGVLQIHVFTNVFIAMGVAQNLWIANERRGRLMLAQTAAGAAVAVGGNAAMIPAFGAPGAAAVAVAAQLTSALLVNAVLMPRLFRMQLGLSVR